MSSRLLPGGLRVCGGRGAGRGAGGLGLVRREGRSLDEGQEGAAPQMDRPWVCVGIKSCWGGSQDSGGGAPVPEKRLEIEPEGVSGGARKARWVEDGHRTGVLDAAHLVSASGGPHGYSGRSVRSPVEPSGWAGGAWCRGRGGGH